MLIRDQKGDQWRKLEGSPQRRREVRKWWKPSSEEAVAWWRHTLMYNYLITGWLSLYHSVLTARGGGLLSSVANPFFGPCWLYLYRARNSGLYVVWWDLILLLLTSSARPCLGPAYLCFAYLFQAPCTVAHFRFLWVSSLAGSPVTSRHPRFSALCRTSTRKALHAWHNSLKLTLTVTQRESGMVTRTRTNETKVRMVAQIPGPSSSAEKEGGY